MSVQREKPACLHRVVWKDMCTECGTDLTKLDIKLPTASEDYVSMVHTVPDLKVSIQDAKAIDKDEEIYLLKERKLHLLVDLDQTIIHTTNDNVPPNLADVIHFQLWGPASPWYHTRKRPGTNEFLERISKLYRLHICTFGTRGYAHIIARHLDPDGKFFYNRILSRDECFSQNSKTANLKDLFPNGDHMVCIIDDREDVWNFAPNLIHVKPYHFFRHTGDINAPPGLAKKDEDEKSGVDFSKVNKKSEVVKEEPKVEPVAASVVEDRETDTPVTVTEENKKIDGEIDTSASGENKKNNSELPDSAPSQTNENNIDEGERELQTNNSTENFNTNKSETDDCKVENEPSSKVDDVIKVEDKDDYLLYLEDILRQIHQAYYTIHDEARTKDSTALTDVKNVIPYVRKKVLKGCNIVFSGVVPVDHSLEASRAYNTAISLGAQVTDRIIKLPKPNSAGSSRDMTPTTHLVAARPGTAKVHEARRYKNIHLVTPDWLWCCAERWERVDEKLFPLYKKSSSRKNSPAQSSSPEGSQNQDTGRDDEADEDALNEDDENDPVFQSSQSQESGSSANKKPGMRRERTASGRFMDTINPLLSFSMDEIESMGHEVDDICNESEESDSTSSSENEDDARKKLVMPTRKVSRSQSVHDQEVKVVRRPTSSSSSSSSSSEEGSSQGYNNRKRKNPRTETETEDEPIAAKFRRGEPLPSDMDTLNLNNASSDDEEETHENTGMGHNLERELFGDGFDESSQDT